MTGFSMDEGRQALVGGAMLAALEAELLGDDPGLRDLFTDLADLLRGWSVASDQAIAVRLRLLVPGGDGYTPADLDNALSDYRFARGEVLTRIRQITDRQENTDE